MARAPVSRARFCTTRCSSGSSLPASMRRSVSRPPWLDSSIQRSISSRGKIHLPVTLVPGDAAFGDQGIDLFLIEVQIFSRLLDVEETRQVVDDRSHDQASVLV